MFRNILLSGIQIDEDVDAKCPNGHLPISAMKRFYQMPSPPRQFPDQRQCVPIITGLSHWPSGGGFGVPTTTRRTSKVMSDCSILVSFNGLYFDARTKIPTAIWTGHVPTSIGLSHWHSFDQGGGFGISFPAIAWATRPVISTCSTLLSSLSGYKDWGRPPYQDIRGNLNGSCPN